MYRLETGKQDIEYEKQVLEQQKKKVEEEREMITEKYILLSDERLLLEKERREFEVQYGKWIVDSQNEGLCSNCNNNNPYQPKQIVPNSPSILRLLSSPGMSPISKRKNWKLPEDTNQFINQLSFRNEIVEDDEKYDNIEF